MRRNLQGPIGTTSKVLSRRNVQNVHKSSLDKRRRPSDGAASCAFCLRAEAQFAAPPQKCATITLSAGQRPARIARLCRCTSSTSSATFSGGVNCEMPWPRLKTWPGMLPKLSSTARASVRIDGGRREQHRGIDVALQCHASPTRSRASPRLTVQSRPTASTPIVGDLLEPQAAALGERDHRHLRAVVLALQLRHHLLRCSRREKRW